MPINKSIITGKLSGMLGKELVFREWDGKTVVAKAPKSRKGDPTPDQAKTQEKFLLASRYAKAILKDKDMADGYATALRPRQNVYSRALEDFVAPPRVLSFNIRGYSGTVGDQITVRALDDFRVATVLLEIYATDGSLLEQGNAALAANGIDWAYTAIQANNLLAGSRIKAIAIDVPGNEGILELSL
jgi:hypothetical protein